MFEKVVSFDTAKMLQSMIDAAVEIKNNPDILEKSDYDLHPPFGRLFHFHSIRFKLPRQSRTQSAVATCAKPGDVILCDCYTSSTNIRSFILEREDCNEVIAQISIIKQENDIFDEDDIKLLTKAKRVFVVDLFGNSFDQIKLTNYLANYNPSVELIAFIG